VPWRLVETTSAAAHGRLGRTALLDDRLLPNPAFTVNRVGRGAVGYVPANLFRDFARNRYPLTRAFVGECVRKTAGRLGIEAAAPVCVDVALRRKGRRRVVHLVNRASGIPNQANNGAIDEIPAVGPVRLTLRLDRRPARVRAAFERQPVEWTYVARGRSGTLRVRLPSVRIHAALVIE
jgi:hypothetical protein